MPVSPPSTPTPPSAGVAGSKILLTCGRVISLFLDFILTVTARFPVMPIPILIDMDIDEEVSDSASASEMVASLTNGHRFVFFLVRVPEFGSTLPAPSPASSVVAILR